MLHDVSLDRASSEPLYLQLKRQLAYQINNVQAPCHAFGLIHNHVPSTEMRDDARHGNLSPDLYGKSLMDMMHKPTVFDSLTGSLGGGK